MKIGRRGFLANVGAAGLTVFTPDLARAFTDHDRTSAQDADLLLDEDEGEVYLIGPRQGRVVIKVDRERTDIGSSVRPGEPPKDLSDEDWTRINEEFGVVYR